MWHYFNDSVVEARVPEGDAQDDAYVLFYRRSGLPYRLQMPESLWEEPEQQEVEAAAAAAAAPSSPAELEEEVLVDLPNPQSPAATQSTNKWSSVSTQPHVFEMAVVLFCFVFLLARVFTAGPWLLLNLCYVFNQLLDIPLVERMLMS